MLSAVRVRVAGVWHGDHLADQLYHAGARLGHLLHHARQATQVQHLWHLHTCLCVHVSTCPCVLAQDVDAQDAVCDDPGLDHGRLGGAAASVRVEQVGRIFCENNNREC